VKDLPRSLWIALILATGCSHERPALIARWAGADSGRLVAPVVATWCQERRLLEITAVADDSGLGLVVYPGPNGLVGTIPLFDPLTDSIRRPSAAVAVRWPKVDMILGYRSIDGVAHLTGGAGTISGSIQGRLLLAGSAADTLSMDIQILALPVDSSAGSCPPDSAGTARPPGSPGVP